MFVTNPLLDEGEEEKAISGDRYQSEELRAETGTHAGHQEEVQG